MAVSTFTAVGRRRVAPSSSESIVVAIDLRKAAYEWSRYYLIGQQFSRHGGMRAILLSVETDMANSADPCSTSQKTHLWRFVAVGVAAAIVTVPSIFYDFVQDDHLLIVDNPTITSWRNLGHILTSDYFARIGYEGKVGYCRPLTNLSYLIDHTLWGLSPTGFHLTNVVMSIITTLALLLY